VFHATVVERKKFGPIGWNRPYDFADTDFFISLSQLQTCINSHSEIPFELIQYLIGKLNYGGRITLDQDENAFMAILDGFIGEETVRDGFCNIAESTYYPVPEKFTIAQFRTYLRKFPDVDKPEIFGLDENSTIIRSQTEAKTLLEKVFELEFASKNLIKSDKTNDENDEMIVSKYTAIKEKMHKIITELPELLNEEECKRKFPISYEE
jgi:dynein heavy chain, axonemal